MKTKCVQIMARVVKIGKGIREGESHTTILTKLHIEYATKAYLVEKSTFVHVS